MKNLQFPNLIALTFISILTTFLLPLISSAKASGINITIASDNNIISEQGRNLYRALRDADCPKAFEIIEENSINEQILDPDILAFASIMYEAGTCFPMDTEQAFTIVKRQPLSHLQHRLRYAYLKEFGIGTEENPSEALLYYQLSLVPFLEMNDKEFYYFYTSTYFDAYLSGKKTTPLLNKAIEKTHRMSSGDRKIIQEFINTIPQKAIFNADIQKLKDFLKSLN